MATQSGPGGFLWDFLNRWTRVGRLSCLCCALAMYPECSFLFLWLLLSSQWQILTCSSGPSSDHLPNGLTSCLCVAFPLVLPFGTECCFLDDGLGAQEPILLGTAGLCWVLGDCEWRGCFHNGFGAYQQLSYWAFDAFLAVNNLMGFFSFCRLDLFFGPVKHICLTGGLNIYSYTACSKKLRGSDFRIGTQGHVGSLKSLVPFALHSTCWIVKMVKTVVIFFRQLLSD